MRRALVLIALSACGDGSTAPTDAIVAPDDGDAGLVTFLLQGGVPFPDGPPPQLGGFRVYFRRASGALAAVTLTDSSGAANARLPDGGSVTAVVGATIYVYTGVHPGDDLVAGASQSASAATTSTVNFNLKPYGTDGAYRLHTSCIDGANPFLDATSAVGNTTPFGLYNCDGDQRTDLLFTAHDQFVSNPVAAHYFPDFLLTSTGNTVFITDAYDPCDSTVRVINGPPTIRFMEINQELWHRHRILSSAEFGDPNIDLSQGDATVTVGMPTPDNATLVTTARDLGTSRPTGRQNVVQWGPASEDVVIDLGTPLIDPLLSRPILDWPTSTVRWRDGNADNQGGRGHPDTVVIGFDFGFSLAGISALQLSGPYYIDALGGASFTIPSIPELAPLFGVAPLSVDIIKFQLGDLPARQQLLTFETETLAQGSFLFPISGERGRVVYETINHDVTGP